jgi:hypothetical protein
MKRTVTAPVIEPGTKPKWPASYFPSIEAKYGEPVQHWIDLAVAGLQDHRHMEVVAQLKDEHGLGHGHANAVVAYVRAALERTEQP